MDSPQAIIGDIWRIRRPRDYVVIPTNIGWTREGLNPMGRGIARQAVLKYADVAAWYGRLCAQYKAALPVCSHDVYRLVFFPTKPLNVRNPALSWKNNASLDLVRQGRVQLVRLLPTLAPGGRVLLPAVGCGEGNLDPLVVVPELLELCDHTPRVTVVLDPKTAEAAGRMDLPRIEPGVDIEAANMAWGLSS